MTDDQISDESIDSKVQTNVGLIILDTAPL